MSKIVTSSEIIKSISQFLSPLPSLFSPLSPHFIVCILLLFPGCKGVQHHTDSPETTFCIHTINICDSVIMVGTGWDNVTAISTQKGIVVIDAGISYSLTAKYREVIGKRFSRNDFAYVINTHAHHDHTRGNPAFSDAVIVGHISFLTEIPAIWKDTARVRSWSSETIKYYQAQLDTLEKDSPEWKEAFCNKVCYEFVFTDASGEPKFAVPELTFDDSLTIHSGDVTFCLLHFGKAHSASDVIIHIPEKKILLVGDLFSKYGKAGFGRSEKADAEKWLRAMDWIESRMNAIEIIIGGHGAILTKEDLHAFEESVQSRISTTHISSPEVLP